MTAFESFDYALPIVIWTSDCTDEELDGVEDRVRVLALEHPDDGLLLAAFVAESLRMRTESHDSPAWGCMAEIAEQFALHLLELADGKRR